MARKPTPAPADQGGANQPPASPPAGDGATPPNDDANTGESPVKVRVLVETAGHRIDDVIELTPDAAALALSDGWGDPSPEAVAFAESLRA